MNAYIRPILISFFLTFSTPFTAAANELSDTLNSMAAKLIEQLVMEQKFVLKVTPPEETGLPESFLRSIAGDVEAALLFSSEFKIKMINRNTTEDLWSEAIEFGDADFEKLYSASKSDAAIIISPRATTLGVEISINVYQLFGKDAGKVLAATGSFLLEMDIKNALGVDLKTVGSEVEAIKKQLERLKSVTEVIAEPISYAEFFHNAKIFSEQGDVVTAIINLIEASKKQPQIIDPLVKMVELIEFKFGRGSIDAFVLSKYPNISDRNKRIIKLLQGSTELDFIDVSVQSYLDPVELALWLNTKTASISSKLTKCQMSYQNGSNEWIRLRACTNVQQNTSFIFELASIEYAKQVLRNQIEDIGFNDFILDGDVERSYIQRDLFISGPETELQSLALSSMEVFRRFNQQNRPMIDDELLFVFEPLLSTISFYARKNFTEGLLWGESLSFQRGLGMALIFLQLGYNSAAEKAIFLTSEMLDEAFKKKLENVATNKIPSYFICFYNDLNSIVKQFSLKPVEPSVNRKIDFSKCPNVEAKSNESVKLWVDRFEVQREMYIPNPVVNDKKSEVRLGDYKKSVDGRAFNDKVSGISKNTVKNYTYAAQHLALTTSMEASMSQLIWGRSYTTQAILPIVGAIYAANTYER